MLRSFSRRRRRRRASGRDPAIAEPQRLGDEPQHYEQEECPAGERTLAVVAVEVRERRDRSAQNGKSSRIDEERRGLPDRFPRKNIPAIRNSPSLNQLHTALGTLLWFVLSRAKRLHRTIRCMAQNYRGLVLTRWSGVGASKEI